MLGNIWLSSALVITAIFSAGAAYKSYSDIQEAKQIQENYEIVSQIKTLIAKQYNKNPADITRDEIIAHLPLGVNWEKVLLLDRNKDSHLSNKELVNKDGDFAISKDERLKLFALKAKLKDIENISEKDNMYTFESGKGNKNIVFNDKVIDDSVKRAIYMLSIDILFTDTTVPDSQLLTKIDDIVDEFMPEKYIYQDLILTATEISANTITDEDILKKKKSFFKTKIKERLFLNQSSIESKLYIRLKNLL